MFFKPNVKFSFINSIFLLPFSLSVMIGLFFLPIGDEGSNIIGIVVISSYVLLTAYFLYIHFSLNKRSKAVSQAINSLESPKLNVEGVVERIRNEGTADKLNLYHYLQGGINGTAIRLIAEYIAQNSTIKLLEYHGGFAYHRSYTYIIDIAHDLNSANIQSFAMEKKKSTDISKIRRQTKPATSISKQGKYHVYTKENLNALSANTIEIVREFIASHKYSSVEILNGRLHVFLPLSDKYANLEYAEQVALGLAAKLDSAHV